MTARRRVPVRLTAELYERLIEDATHRCVAMSDLLIGSYLHAIGEGPLDLCIARARAEATTRDHLADIAPLGGHAKAAKASASEKSSTPSK